MQRVEVRDIYTNSNSYAEYPITVCGWVRTVRDSKSVAFIEVNDGSCLKGLQLVLNADLFTNYKSLVKINVGASVQATGSLILTPQAKQPFELNVTALELLGTSSEDYPLQKKRHSLEFLREIPHLRPRTNTFNAVFRVRSTAALAIHRFFHEQGFLYVHTPIITASDCEGAGETFTVTTLPAGNNDYSNDFFRRKASLTVSGQLEGEYMATAFGKIYTFGPTFRAEKSYTTRHAAEFWMVEPELAFADLEDIMSLSRDMLQYTVHAILDECPDEISFFTRFFDHDLDKRLQDITETDFAHVTYTEAIGLLSKHNDNFTYPVEWGCDLQTEHERFLTEQTFGMPVFVMNYPKQIKAFYMKQNGDGKTVAAMDLLVPGVGELIGGSQREDDLTTLTNRLHELGLDVSTYQWYLDLRKYGSVPHAGYGLGFERLIMYLTGMQNIRDVLPFPNTAGSCFGG